MQVWCPLCIYDSSIILKVVMNTPKGLVLIKLLTNFGQSLLDLRCGMVKAGSTITNRREPRSCLGRVFNSKLGCIVTLGSKCMVYMQPLLKLKTQPKARPVS